MSRAGAGKPNRIPGMIMNGNVPNMQVPPDVEWDESDPPVVFNCSQHTEHQPHCNGNCGSKVIVSETQCDLMNEARAWARLEMPFSGVPMGLPFPGIPVEIFDLMIWLEVTKELLYKLDLVEEHEFEESYRERKLAVMRGIREANEGRIRQQRASAAIGVPQRPPLLGPDGTPLM